MILVNLKTYEKSTGEKAREIAEDCLKASKDTGEEVIVSPQPADLLRFEELNLEIYAQHIHPVNPGSHTGHILAETVAEAGCSGTLLNHSEKRIEKEAIKESIKRARENGLSVVLCAQDPEECRELSKLDPDFIAYEPPELIGGDISVSSAKPELIEKAVEKSEAPVLTGAGIKSRKDVEKSVDLGCEGVLVASGVVKSENPYESVRELCEGL